MKKLKIFYPSKTISFHVTTIILILLTSSFFIIYEWTKFFPEKKKDLEVLITLTTVLMVIYWIFYAINNYFRHEYAKGHFEGFLIIENDKIICNKEIYLINEIEKISILHWYFRGKFNGNISAFSAKKENGLKNYIEITTNNKTEKYYFLQTQKENIKMFKDEIRTYYRFGKLNEQNYKNIVE